MTERPRRRGRRNRGPDSDVVERIVQPQSRIAPYELASAEQEELIHEMSMRILEEAGIAFYDDEAVKRLRAGGASVGDNQVARFDRAMIEELVAKAPASWVHSGRNPERSVTIGGDHIAFAPVAGPPFVHDIDGGRRDGTLEDLNNFVKLTYMSPYLHISGTEICTPSDVPFHERALDINYAHYKYSDKPVMGHYPIGLSARDSVGMARCVYGADRVDREHFLLGVVNISSPRRLDDRMLGLLHEYALANQALVITPFILAGAMGPAAILGTVAQANAEALATIAYAQLVRPGAPCIYGPFLAAVDLQSGAPVFGAAESTLAQFLVAQMSRRYGLPFRGAGQYISSKVPDMQAGYESVMSMFPSMLTQPNFILHAAGWTEAGLVTSYEKFILDLELSGVYLRFAAGVSWDDDEWAMESVVGVPPGGHHLGTDHTMGRFRTAFHRTNHLDYNSFEQWKALGSEWSDRRANKAWKEMLASYEAPPLDEATDEALLDYMARRRPELDPADFQ